ncbi:MAG: TldD/PmbA family protein [Candidatus Kariarchaeaceae archaeon]
MSELYTPEYLSELISKVNDYALSKNVDAAEVFYQYQKELQIVAENQSIATERDKSELGFAIRVLKNGSEGFSYSNKIDLDALKACTDEAIGVANVSQPKQGNQFPSPTTYPVIDGIYSSSVADIQAEDIITQMKIVLEVIRDSPIEIRVNLSPLSKSENWFGIVNSNGVEGFQKSNDYTGGFFAVAREGEKIGSFVVNDFFTRDPSSIDYAQFGKELVDKAIQNMTPSVLKSIDSDVVVFKKEAIFPLAFVLAFTINADNVQQNRSKWKDKLADKVAIDSLTIMDDSHNIKCGGFVKSFDDEGSPTQTTTIIKNGFLETFLFDELRANRAGAETTGNASRGFGGSKFLSPPSTIMPNALSIIPGDMSFDEMIEDIREGIIFDRFSGSYRAENGMLSGVVKGAQLIRNGELAEPLTNVTIGTNVFDVFNNIEGLGKETDLVSGFLTTPLIKSKGVPISTQN